MEAMARLLVHSLSGQPMLIAYSLPASEAQAEQDTHPQGLAASNGTVTLVSIGRGAGASAGGGGKLQRGRLSFRGDETPNSKPGLLGAWGGDDAPGTGSCGKMLNDGQKPRGALREGHKVAVAPP